MIARTLLQAALLLLAWAAAPAAFAADQCDVSATSANVLGDLAVARAKDCFGGTADRNPLAVKIVAIQKCDAESRPDLLKLRQQLADASRAVEAASQVLASTAPPEWAPVTTPLGTELQKSTSELQDIEAISAASYWDWDDHEALQQANGEFLVSYGALVDAKCPAGGARPDCARALATAIDVNRLVNLTHRLHQCAAEPHLTGIRKRLAQLDADWDAYFFNTRSQYLWELAINSWRFKARDDVFAEPPGDQVIVAHPGITYEYVGGGARNDKSYEAILMADLVGYNRFRWRAHGDGTPSRLPPLGVSLVGTYSPDNDGEHLGFGVMFHVNNVYSLGVARRDTGAGKETVYLLSADLMRFLLKPSEASQTNFRGAGAPGTVP